MTDDKNDSSNYKKLIQRMNKANRGLGNAFGSPAMGCLHKTSE